VRYAREIFARYIAGETPRAIAHDLNKRGVRPARGRLWNASTINGNVSRGGGMILILYAGPIVWNKVRMIILAGKLAHAYPDPAKES
jgi:site-specific DNA recombinase